MTKKVSSSDLGKLPEVLAHIRKLARLSQKDLAVRAGIARSAVSAIERGATRPKADTLRLIANGLAKEVDGSVDEERSDVFYGRLMDAAGYNARPRSRNTSDLVQIPLVRARVSDSGEVHWVDTRSTLTIRGGADLRWRPLLATDITRGGLEPYVAVGDTIIFDEARANFGTGEMVVVTDREARVAVRWVWPPITDRLGSKPCLRSIEGEAAETDEFTVRGRLMFSIRSAYRDPQMIQAIKRDFGAEKAAEFLSRLPDDVAPWDRFDPSDETGETGHGQGDYLSVLALEERADRLETHFVDTLTALNDRDPSNVSAEERESDRALLESIHDELRQINERLNAAGRAKPVQTDPELNKAPGA